jgi:C-terminal processing protease CtpA/Prc
VVVPKSKGEILGVVIVESGWGSMLPTVVIANLAPAGAAARCGQLNIGDQIIAINGVSLVGLPVSRYIFIHLFINYKVYVLYVY